VLKANYTGSELYNTSQTVIEPMPEGLLVIPETCARDYRWGIHLPNNSDRGLVEVFEAETWVLVAYLFGSKARGVQASQSDNDIAACALGVFALTKRRKERWEKGFSA
jgi:hypothetical protein